MTDLRKCEEKGELLQPVLFGSVVLLSVMLYFTVSLMDPGFVLCDAEVSTFTKNHLLNMLHEFVVLNNMRSRVLQSNVVVEDEELKKMIASKDGSRSRRRCGYCFLLVFNGF